MSASPNGPCPYPGEPSVTDIYMWQPEGYEEKGSEEKIAKLQKGLYGLKQAGQEWYTTLHDFLVQLRFHHTNSLQEMMKQHLTPSRMQSVHDSRPLTWGKHPGFLGYAYDTTSLLVPYSLTKHNTSRVSYPGICYTQLPWVWARPVRSSRHQVS